MRGQRQERVAELLREELSRIIQRELDDPRLAGLISVTEVSVPPDLRQAQVFVSVYGDDEARKKALAGLKSAAKRIRHQLAQAVQLRHTPELEFNLDTSLERGDRILRLLAELKVEENGEGQAGDDPDDSEADSGPR